MHDIRPSRDTWPAPCSHAGHLLMQGLQTLPGEFSAEALGPHFDRVCAVQAPAAYRVAYERMKLLQAAWQPGVQAMVLATQGRLFLGLSTPSLHETSVALDATYGVPTIRGEACKGLVRRMAQRNALWTEAHINALFGSTQTGNGQGLVRFLDAWWVPDSSPASPKLTAGAQETTNRPLVREVVTPHHPKFQEAGHRRSVFDEPNPVPLLAAHGSFRFAVAGPTVWAEAALALLKQGLASEGIGARTPEYGRFA
jgi:CRISPR type III-B/RAMP module RAMP protein Cmr6